MKRFLACLLAMLLFTGCALAEEINDSFDYEEDPPMMVDLFLGVDQAAGEAWAFTNDTPDVLDVTNEGYTDVDESGAEVSIAKTQSFRISGLAEGMATVTFRRAIGDGEPNLTLQYVVYVTDDLDAEIYTIITK